MSQGCGVICFVFCPMINLHIRIRHCNKQIVNLHVPSVRNRFFLRKIAHRIPHCIKYNVDLHAPRMWTHVFHFKIAHPNSILQLINNISLVTNYSNRLQNKVSISLNDFIFAYLISYVYWFDFIVHLSFMFYNFLCFYYPKRKIVSGLVLVP